MIKEEENSARTNQTVNTFLQTLKMHVSCLVMNENEQDDIGHIYCPCNVFIKKHSFSAVKKVVM